MALWGFDSQGGMDSDEGVVHLVTYYLRGFENWRLPLIQQCLSWIHAIFVVHSASEEFNYHAVIKLWRLII